MLYWELVCVKAILLYSESIWVKDIMLYSVPKSVPAFVRPGFDNKQTWNERNEFSLCKHYIRINLLCHPGGKPRRRIYKQKKNEFKSWTEPVKLYYRPKLFVVGSWVHHQKAFSDRYRAGQFFSAECCCCPPPHTQETSTSNMFWHL